MLALLCLLAVQTPPPDPAGEPPPPPALLDDSADGRVDAPVGDDAPPAAPSAATPTPPPDAAARRAPVVAHREPGLLPRPVAGGLAAAAGATFGGALGAALVVWGAYLPGVEPMLLAVGALGAPALVAFFAGAAFVAFAIEEPAVEDLGLVAGCTAIGCLSMALLAGGLVGGGSLCSLGTGCTTAPPCCGGAPGPSPVDAGEGDQAVLFATGGGGIGAAVGLGIGFLLGLNAIDTQTGDPVQVMALSAGAGLLVGSLAGGAVGGVIGGTRDDSSFARARARRARSRSAPGSADRPR